MMVTSASSLKMLSVYEVSGSGSRLENKLVLEKSSRKTIITIEVPLGATLEGYSITMEADIEAN